MTSSRLFIACPLFDGNIDSLDVQASAGSLARAFDCADGEQRADGRVSGQAIQRGGKSRLVDLLEKDGESLHAASVPPMASEIKETIQAALLTAGGAFLYPRTFFTISIAALQLSRICDHFFSAIASRVAIHVPPTHAITFSAR